MYPIILRFTKTLICADCNQAEGAMKAALGKSIDRHFSFSPSEIRRFIVPRPNETHELRTDIGREIWHETAATFHDRSGFARELAQRVQAGLQDCERSAPGQHDRSDERHMIYKLALQAARVQGVSFTLGTDITARSRSTDGIASAVRLVARPGGVAPTDEEFHTFNQQMKSPPWHRAGDAWSCLICDRGKRGILRKSNRGRWTAHIHSLNSFELETDPRGLEFRSRHGAAKMVFRSHQRYQVCQDCRQVVTDAASFGASEDCLGPDALSELVSAPRLNTPHSVDRNAIRACLARNADWASAAQDYWSHYHRARAVAAGFDYLVAKGWREENAFGQKLSEYMDETDACSGRTPDEFEWLLREGLDFLRSEMNAILPS